MGRIFILNLVLFLLFAGCETSLESNTLFPGCGNTAELGNGVVLLPHHLLVEDQIEAMYSSLDDAEWDHVVIISPDHFYAGTSHISKSVETEHGFTIHRDFAKEHFPDAEVEGYMIQSAATSEELDSFVDALLAEETERQIGATHESDSTLYIFTIDFSHYLPGGIAYIHDARSMDVLNARSEKDVRSLEVDSPATAELLVKTLLAKNLVLVNMLNTNPSKDIGVDTFENTTHIFACSTGVYLNKDSVGDASGEGADGSSMRDLYITMYFAHPEEWYLGKTQEDRYLYGYDEVFFDQGGADHAVVENRLKGTSSEFTFDYFK